MEKYKIGQLSKSMGVSSHLLKHYEKFNLVYPSKDNSTNYRYYDLGQCRRIIESKKYRNMGFALKDTAYILNEMSIDEIDSMMENQIEELEAQIARLEMQKFLAKRFYEDGKRAQECLDQWFIIEMEEFRYLEQTNNRELIEGADLAQFEESMLDYAPVAKSYIMLERESFYQEEQIYHWGIGFWSKELNELEHQNILIEQLDYIPKGRAFLTYIKLEVPYIENYSLRNAIYEKYREFDTQQPKDAYAIMVKSGLEEGKQYHYYAVYIRL